MTNKCMTQTRDNMFYIGIILFSLVLFAEHLFSIETPVTCFFKGLACGLELVGVFFLIRKQRKSS